MSKNKNQLARFRRIHELLSLRKGTVIHPDELCRACDISRRTLDNDISFMRLEFNAPITWDKSRRGYFYEHPFDLTAQIALNIEDVHRLQVAAETLSQFGHLEVFQDLRHTVDKIRKGVNGWVRSSGAAKHIYFEPVQYTGTNHLPTLLKAIEEKRKIQIDYQSFKQDEAQVFVLEPYCIRQYDQRWYVVGRTPDHDYIKPFALERILGKPQPLKDFFTMPNDFDPVRFFSHIYGMHPEPLQAAQHVELEFTPLQARYFLSKPFHPYTLVNQDQDGSIQVRLLVCINIELVRKIASLGHEVKVLSPSSLQERIRNFHSASLSIYL